MPEVARLTHVCTSRRDQAFQLWTIALTGTQLCIAWQVGQIMDTRLSDSCGLQGVLFLSRGYLRCTSSRCSIADGPQSIPHLSIRLNSVQQVHSL